MENKAIIQLKSIQFPFVKMDVENYQDVNNKVEVNFSININNNFRIQECSKSFEVVLAVAVKASNGIIIDVTAKSVFSTSEDITDEFIRGNFPNVNAPAIVYPYIRAYISNLTVNGGYPAIIIPAVNFQYLAEKQRADR